MQVQYAHAVPSGAHGKPAMALYAISTAPSDGQPMGLPQVVNSLHSQTGIVFDSHSLLGGGMQLQTGEHESLPRQEKSSGSSHGEPLMTS